MQILINLEHFEHACHELELLLAAARSQSSSSDPIALKATGKFRDNKKRAEKRIFEVVNSKIDDLIETAEYDWMTTVAPTEPSNYMQTLTRFLSNIMNSTLLGLPKEIKELIYFDALSHASTMILVSFLCIPHVSVDVANYRGGPSINPRSEANQSQWGHGSCKRRRIFISIRR